MLALFLEHGASRAPSSHGDADVEGLTTLDRFNVPNPMRPQAFLGS